MVDRRTWSTILCMQFFLLGFQVCASNASIEIFRHLSSQSTLNKDVYDKSVTIKCPVICKDCPIKGVISWRFNGTDLSSGNGIMVSDDVSIGSFENKNHSGLYTCILSAGHLVIRGPDIQIRRKPSPSFTIEDQRVPTNGNAVFSCYANTKWNSDRFNVRWYKNSAPISTSSKVVAWEEMLFINDVQSTDIGEYQCEMWSYDGSMKIRSPGKQLSLVPVDSQTSTIHYSTKQKEVLEGEEFTLACATHGQISIVNLYEHNTQHSYLIGEGKGFIRKTLIANKSSSYSCEAEWNRIRAREDIEVRVVGAPKLSDPHPMVISEQIAHAHVKLDCNLEQVPPSTKIMWYRNGILLANENSRWLQVSKLKVDNTGVYQCIASNGVGAAMKLIYVSLETTGLTPQSLKVFIYSPTIFEASWKPPSNFDVDKLHHYIVAWFDPMGNRRQKSVMRERILVANDGIYGGSEFTLMVCFAYQPSIVAEDCVFETLKMPVGVPTEAPHLKEVVYENDNQYKVIWEALSPEASNGAVYYRIHCRPFIADIKGTKRWIFTQPDGTKDSLIVRLKMQGSYHVWITAHTSKGASPKSNELDLYTENVGPKANRLKLAATWSLEIQNDILLSWQSIEIAEELFRSLEFKVYYVRIPYKDYWKDASSIETNLTSVTIKNLDRSAIYRFTLIALVMDNGHVQVNRKVLGKTSNIYVVPSTIQPANRKRRGTYTIVPAPENLRCVNDFSENEIVILWKSLPRRMNVTGYRVNVFNDYQGVITTYETKQSSLKLDNLPDSFWYGVQVFAYGNQGVMYEKTEFISCRKQTKAPSMPRDVRYMFVFDKETDTAFLRLRWKPPLYTGGSVYSYRIRRKSEEVKEPFFPFLWVDSTMVVGRQDDEYLHYEGMWTDSTKRVALRQHFSIAAVNDDGIGTSYYNVTHSVYFSVSHGKKINPPSQIPASPEEEIDVRIGILIGVCISAFFMIVFFVICTIKEPCKKVPKARLLGSSGDSSDDYLYQQKLLESHSTRSESSGESSIQPKKKRYKPWKFFQKLQRHTQESDDITYVESIRVSYTSGSSGSRTRDCFNKCEPQCTSSCSHVESYCDRSSEGQVQLLPSNPI